MAELTPEQVGLVQEAQKRGRLTPEQSALVDEKLKRQGITTAPAQTSQDAGTKVAPTPSQKEHDQRNGTSVVGQFGTGTSEGMTNTLGAPVDIVNFGLDQVGAGTEKPFMGSKFLQDAIPETLKDGPPQTTSQRIAREAGKAVGETLLTLFPLLKGGQTLAGVGRAVPAGTEAFPMVARMAKSNPQGFARIMDGVTHSMAQLAMQPPGKLARAEMMLAAASGAAGGVAAEAFPEHPETANLIAQLVTSFGIQGTLQMVRVAGRYATEKVVGITVDQMKDVLGKDIADKMGQNFGDAEELMTQRIDEVAKIKEEFPGFEPTAGELMGTEGGLSSQEKLFADQDPRFAQHRQAKLQQSQQALREGLDKDAPGGGAPEDLQAFRDTAAEEVARRQQAFDGLERQADARVEQAKDAVGVETRNVLDAIDTRVKDVDSRIEQRLAAFPQGATKTQRGEVVRAEYLEELEDFRQASKADFQHVAQELPVKGGNTMASLDVMEANRRRFDDLPDDMIQQIRPKQEGEVDDLGRVVGKTPGQGEVEFTFGDMISLRSKLLSEIRDTTNDQRKKFLNDIVDGVELDLQAIATDPDLTAQFPEAVAAYRKAAAFHEQGVMRLKSSAVGSMRKHQGRHFQQSGEDIASAFLRGETELKAFVAAIGHRPQAVTAMRESTLLNFMESAMQNGKIIPGRVKTWVNRMRNIGLFKAFPELEADMTNLGTLQEEAVGLTKLAERFERNPQAFGLKLGPEGQVLNETAIPQLNAAQKHAAEVYRLTKRGRSELDRSAVQAFIGDDANLAAKKVWGSTTPVEKTKEIMGIIQHDPAAVRGFQSAMWDEMVHQFESKAIEVWNKPALQGKAMGQFLDRNEGAMRAMGYTDRQINRMRLSAKGGGILAEAGRPFVKGDSGTAARMQGILTDWGPLLSRLYAGPLGRGLVSWKWTVGERFMRNLVSHFKILRNDQVQDLLMDAFFDPEVAKDLAVAAMAKQEYKIRWTMPNGKTSKLMPWRNTERHRVVTQKKPMRRIQAHLLRLGVPMTDDQQFEGEDDVAIRPLSATEQALSLTHPAGTEPGSRQLLLSGAK